MKLNYLFKKKSILTTLFVAHLIAMQGSAVSAYPVITQSIGTYMSEHKKTLIATIAIAMGLSLNYYFWNQNTDDQQVELELTCLNNFSDSSTVFLFAHGVDPRASASITQPTRYIEKGIIDGPCYTFCFKDSLKNLNFGQERDCRLLANAYEQVHTNHPKADIVIVGVSRGASAIINTIATHKDLNWQPVKAIVLESPYEHIDSLADHIAHSYLFFLPFSKQIMRSLLNTLPAYSSDGIQTIDMAENIPIFIGYSKTDKTVPPQGTCRLIEKLQSNNSVTKWIAQSGRHSTLSLQPGYAQNVQIFLQDKVDNYENRNF